MADTLYPVRNFLVPAFGATYTFPVVLPGANGYSIDFNQVLIDSQPFYPQSITIDATSVPPAETVLFRVAQINFTRQIRGGDTVTFMFPSIANLFCTLTPSDGVSVVRAYFYNYPALTDFYGSQPVTVSGGGAPVTIANDPLNVLQVSGVNFNHAAVADTGALGGQVIIAAPGAGLSIELHALSISYAGDTFSASTLFSAGFLALPLASGRDLAVAVAYPRPIVLPVNTGLTSAVSAASTQSAGAGVLTSATYRIV